jgi:transcriptional regulator with XRE-family HTH domain
MKTGRPKFQIDGARLAALRNEAGLTQKALTSRVHELLNKPAATADTATKHYQKIERTGRTSKAMAEALARALGTTVAVLQGEAPDEVPDWIDSLERQLRHQLEVVTSPALQAALERESEATDPVRTLAVQIAQRLEYIQLGQQRGELARLVELTGWTEAQLMQPVSLHGHWFLLSTVNGARNSAIVLGVNEVLFRIKQSCTEHANVHESDATITVREELPWLHVEVQHPRIPARRSVFSFVRCIPTPSGLHWVNPTWRDRFWLDEPLQSWAFTNANFVVGLDGQAVPRDVRALRLLIERYSEDQTAHWVAEIQGDLEGLPDDILGNFQREGRSHDLVTKWIAAGLWDAVAPLLDEWPADRWQVQSGACIVIGLNASITWGDWAGRAPDFSVKYLLRLVEQVGEGQTRPAPWRRSSVEVIAKTLQRCLSEEAERNRAAMAPRAAPPPA